MSANLRALVADVQSTDWQLRLRGAHGLGAHGTTAYLAHLKALLLDRNEAVSLAASDALGEIAARDPGAVDSLLQWLRQTEEGVRWGSARALGLAGESASNAIPSLIRATADPRGAVAWAAVDSAAQILRAVGSGALKPVIAALRDGNEEVIWGAAWILAKAGPMIDEAKPHLIGMEHHPNKSIRWAATQALRQITD